MARKAKKTSESTQSQVLNPAPAKARPTIKFGPIVAQRKFDRWYVYIQGVNPKVLQTGCPCKTAKSAIRYMFLLKARYGAAISQNVYERLEFEAQKEG